MCSPTARSGGSPLATGTGTLQRGHTGTWISYSQGAGVSLTASQLLKNLDIPLTNTLENKVSQYQGLETKQLRVENKRWKASAPALLSLQPTPFHPHDRPLTFW